MPEHEHTHHPEDLAAAALKAEIEELRAIRGLLAREESPWITPIHFAAPQLLQVTDDKGPFALSYGVYNPVSARIYLGLFGATPILGAFPVPANSALILPIQVPAELRIGIDAGELGEGNSATIYVFRFKAVQPFYLGAI